MKLFEGLDKLNNITDGIVEFCTEYKIEYDDFIDYLKGVLELKSGEKK